MAKLYETINAGNWRKGVGTKDAGCLIRHLHLQGIGLLDQGRHTHETPEYQALIAAVRVLFPERVIGTGVCGPWIFNDHPDTTLDDVLRVCKVADV